MVTRDACVPCEIENQTTVLKGRRGEDPLMPDIVAMLCLEHLSGYQLFCGGQVD